jgi:hypothetical protein
MEAISLIGKQFVVKSYPLVYTVTDANSDTVKVRAMGSDQELLSMPYSTFIRAHKSGEIVLVGEPASTPDTVEEPKEEEPTNFFSFDDL